MRHLIEATGFQRSRHWQARITAKLGDCRGTAELLQAGQELGVSPYYQPGWLGLEVPEFRDLDSPELEQLRRERT